MSTVDVIVLGGGTGNAVAKAAAESGLDTVLVEKGPLGGTCLNRGCNPSKMLLYRASLLKSIEAADSFGIEVTVDSVDFEGIVSDVETTLSAIAADMKTAFRAQENLQLLQSHARFVDERTVAVDGETYTGDRILVAVGSRPVIPPMDGLESVPYLTSDEALSLEEQPDSLVIVGGGYVGAELGYFFEMLGTDVTIVHSGPTLLDTEDPEIATAFTDRAAERHTLVTNHRGTAVETRDGVIAVRATDTNGNQRTVTGDELLVAVGRRPNTDDLGLANTEIETDDRGFVRTDEYLETTAENVWAQGDVAGNFQLKHAGDHERKHTLDAIVHGNRRAVDYTAMPHAVFAEPQIGAVGVTQSDLEAAGDEFVVGKARYEDSAMGRAKELQGLAKVLAAPDGEILGFHVIGYEASTLVHEAVVPMRRDDGSVWDVADAIHAHPTLSRIVEAAFRVTARKLDEPGRA